jgi:hypothetical protein
VSQPTWEMVHGLNEECSRLRAALDTANWWRDRHARDAAEALARAEHLAEIVRALSTIPPHPGSAPFSDEEAPTVS